MLSTNRLADNTPLRRIQQWLNSKALPNNKKILPACLFFRPDCELVVFHGLLAHDIHIGFDPGDAEKPQRVGLTNK
jgi:hypothetical protein